MWASRSVARSPGNVGLLSSSCPSARVFATRFFQTLPRGSALALCYHFASIRLQRGLAPPSHRACSAHNKKPGSSLTANFRAQIPRRIVTLLSKIQSQTCTAPWTQSAPAPKSTRNESPLPLQDCAPILRKPPPQPWPVRNHPPPTQSP